MTDERRTPSEAYAGWMDTVQQAKLERLKLFYTHKAHGSLSVYYEMFPDEKDAWPARERRQSRNEGNER